MRSRLVAGLLALAALVACDPGEGPQPGPTGTTSPGPATETAAAGLEVAVVLAPDSGVATLENRSLALAADDVEDDVDLDVSEIRVLEPPDEPFRRDQIAFAAEEGADLVCTVGDDGADDIAALAPRFPATRFCLIGGGLREPPPNAVTLEWDLRAGAFLAGFAAALSRPDAHAGIVVRSPSAGFEVVRTGFDAGVRTARAEARAIASSVPSGSDQDDPRSAAAETARALHEGDPPVRVVLPYGDPELVAGVIEVFAEDGYVIGWGADLVDVLTGLDGPAPQDATDHVVVSVVKRYETALRGAIRHITDGADLPVLGVEAYALVPGGAADVLASIEPRLDQLVQRIVAGEITTDPPPAAPPTPAPS